MRFHHLPLRCRQLTGLEQYIVWYADLADVMQWRGLRDEIDRAYVQQFGVVRGKARMAAQLFGQQPDIFLHPPQMFAGLQVARLGQMRQGADADVLHQLVVMHATVDFLLQKIVLVLELLTRLSQFQLVAYPRQYHRRTYRLGDVVGRTQRQSVFFVGIGAHGGDKDHRQVLGQRIGAQPGQHLKAVQVRHHDVEQYQIGLRLQRCQFQRTRAGVGRTHRIAVLQQLSQHGQVLRAVIDNQQCRPHIGWWQGVRHRDVRLVSHRAGGVLPSRVPMSALAARTCIDTMQTPLSWLDLGHDFRISRFILASGGRAASRYNWNLVQN